MTEVDDAFEAALAAEAGAQLPAEAPPPPAIDLDAPFGRSESGEPIAPHGLKADGRPRRHPAGPGRPKEDKPRVQASASPKAPGAKGDADYSDQLGGLGTSVWLAASVVKGGRLLGFRLPDLRPYACAWKAQLPQQVAAWNAAAQQNATVRGYVDKFTGDGSMTWMVGVAVAAAGFAAGCAEIAKAGPEFRAQLAAANDAQVQEFVQAQVDAMGVAA